MIDISEAIEAIEGFLQDKLKDSGAEGYVLGISGGIDSATTASIAVEAVGEENVTGLIMPGDPSRDGNMEDARELCEDLGIEYREIDVEPATTEILDSVNRSVSEYNTGNVRARVRMNLLYLEANENDLLVLGTGNRSEYLLGYFTKHGDGAADVAPIVNLYKTEVKELARELRVPEKFVEKEPTAGLWEGQSDEDELGATYEVIDKVLRGIVDEDRGIEDIVEETGTAPEKVQEIFEMYTDSEHKRSGAASPGLR